MNIVLNQNEARVIGCLMEKAVVTPDQYPLTLNGLTNACNQKSSREPVLSLEPGEVQRTARALEDRSLLSSKENFKSGVVKFEHRLCNTPLGELQFDEAEYAVICLMLLRGPQTPGELRSRSGRLCQFADNEEVVETLKALMEREGGAVVARLPRQSGRRDSEYMHLFSGHIESAPEEATAPAESRSAGSSRIGLLEARVDTLERELGELKRQLGVDDRDTLDDGAPDEPPGSADPGRG